MIPEYPGYYSIDEMTRSIIEEYKLVNFKDADEKKFSKDDLHYWAFYCKVRNALKINGLLPLGVTMVNPKTNRKCKYFTEEHRNRILSNTKFHDYLIDNSYDDEIKSGRKFAELDRIKKASNQEYIEYLTLQMLGKEEEKRGDPCITDEEFKTYKNNMMLKALFELFFMPIDEKLYLNDLVRTQLITEYTNLQDEDIYAIERLKHPEGTYYRRRATNDETKKINQVMKRIRKKNRLEFA